MRKKLLALILFCCGLKFSHAQQWNVYHPTATFDINAVDILGAGHIAIGGGRESNDSVQTMFMSTDYGITWIENVHDGFASWNKSIAFADSLNGFGVGYQGRIIQSNDGCQNWGYSVFPTSYNLNKIVNVSPSIYYAVGGQQGNNPVETIIKTANGGLSWNVIYDTAGPCLKSVYFNDPLKGFAVGDSGVILSSIDGGNSWNFLSAPVQRNFNAITFINVDTGFIVGGDQNNRTILQTVDGGINWTILIDNAGRTLNDISFVNEIEGYVVGDSAGVLKTIDGGQTWTPVVISNNLTGMETFNAVKFYNSNFGVIGGKGGVLYVYTGWQVDVFTLGSEIRDSTTADIFAAFNTNGYPATERFTYSSDSTFSAGYIYTQSQALTTDSFIPVSAHLINLTPNTWYYYFVTSGNKTGDTLKFYTGSLNTVFKTLSGDVADSTTLILKGEIHGINPVGNIIFEYGTSPLLGGEIAGSPASINDTADHNVSAVLTSAQQQTYYYYRLRGETGGDTIYGDIKFVGSLYGLLETLPANYFEGDSIASLNGAVQGFQGSVTVNFEYSTAQGPVQETFPFTILNTDTFHPITAGISSLQLGQLYYFRIKAQSGIGTYYGRLLAFYTGNRDSLLHTLPAQNVTSTSATLEGFVNHLPDAATLSFEYSTDSSFVNSVPATPATVNDSLYHQVSAVLSGAPANRMYYYRLKAVTANAGEFYGNICQFFLGDNEIPNWDFELWQNRNALLPQNWVILGNNAQQVAGHTGYALKLNYRDVAVNSVFESHNISGAGPIFIDGKPFHARPDSIWFYLNANEAPGDTPHLYLQLYSGNSMMATNLFSLPTNTGGTFKRVAFPISYSSGATPDSIVMGVGACLSFGSSPCNLSSNISIDDIGFSPAAPVLPNADFENWFSCNYNELEGWLTDNLVSTAISQNNITCVTETFSNPADHAAQIQNYNWNGHLLGAQILLKPEYLDQGPAFPVNGRHQSLTGYYKFFPVNGDSTLLNVSMFKNGIQIGGATLATGDSVTTFTRFEIPIFYNGSLEIPDSASIQISCFSQNVNGTSTLIVDKLSFDNPAFLSAELITPEEESKLKVYPNPASNILVIESDLPFIETDLVELLDLNGRVAAELKPGAGYKAEMDLSGINAGFYMVHLSTRHKTINKKLIILK